jgi:DNA mismatch endonuclease (patch repair protein)
MDNLTKTQRSLCMSRVRTADTDIETVVSASLRKRGLRFRKHVRELAGTPDLVFSAARVAVFIDGDFWHGYRFPTWRASMSRFWQEKIERNRARDRRNFARLRRLGWTVIRLWQHEIRTNPVACVDRIVSAVRVYPASRHDQRRAHPS